jgi:hypothetical protein
MKMALRDARFWAYETAVFNKAGDDVPVVVFVYCAYYPRSDPRRQTVPPISPVRGLDLVYKCASIEVHEAGNEVCVGAFRIDPARTHAFIATRYDNGPPILFVRQAVPIPASELQPNSGAVVPLVSIDVSPEIDLSSPDQADRMEYIRGTLGYTRAAEVERLIS